MPLAEPRHEGLTWWSVVTGALAIPIWWATGILGTMPKASLDGGIFISVVGGLRDGLPLYSGVWDNKDPLFYLGMSAASFAGPQAMYVLDWVWVALAALGSYLLARPLMSADRALVVGAILTPIVVLGVFYSAGLTNLPGTSVALLGLGLLLSGKWVAGGFTLGVLAFLKLVVWPIGLVAIVIALVIPGQRRSALKAAGAMAAVLAAGLALMAVVGWLAPYVDALVRNRSYASDVISYFGYVDSPMGHLQRLVDDWSASPHSGWLWLSVGSALLVLLASSVRIMSCRAVRTTQRLMLLAWALAATLLSWAVLALTYVWGHHSQLWYVPALIILVLGLSLVPVRLFFMAFLGIGLIGAWVFSGWGNPVPVADRLGQQRESWTASWTSLEEAPIDARLLETAGADPYAFARLGTNDDGGFLFWAPEKASLACPQFHLYDFSPDEDFVAMLECIQDVDVILVTDNFVVFGNGGKAAVVQPILQYVDGNFDCLRVDDRQVCTRRPI